MKKGLLVFLKQRNLLIKREEYSLRLLREEFESLYNDISRLEVEYSKINGYLDETVYVADIAFFSGYGNLLLKRLKDLKSNMDILNGKIEEQKEKLSKLNAEKKAVEKYLKRKEREDFIFQLIQEGRLADEVFSRSFAAYDADSAD